MPTFPTPFRQAIQITQTVIMRATQVMRSVRRRLRSRMALAAEHLFLQKQVALYQENNAPWRCDMHATRLILVWLSYWFDWQPALTIVQPETFKRWRRQGWRLVWKTPSKPGRPPIPPELQALIRRMSQENLTWGQQRIVKELLLKLGLRVSPRTIRSDDMRYVERSPPVRRPSRDRASVSVVQARSAARVDVRSILPSRWRRGLEYPEAQGAASALNGAIQCDSCP